MSDGIKGATEAPKGMPGAPEGALIPQFFAHRSVLITGATGFMGKVLVERLLTTCPDVRALHLLVRSKRDAPPETRLADLKNSPVFDVLRERNPQQLQKLHLVAGDITKPGLALTPATFAQLEEVSVIFHCAATVKFNEPLRVAVQQNVLSVTRVLELADRLRDVAAFVHVSTAYCNSEHQLVEERVYPLSRDLPGLLAEALAVPDHTSADCVARFIAPKSNTYTFSKAMGEVAVEAGSHRYPVAIFRPTIVMSSVQHPFPGWLEGYNGPAGAVVAMSMGGLRVLPGRGRVRGDLLPVDVAIDALIAVAWETAEDRLPTVRVYNCAMGKNPLSWEEVQRMALEGARAHPLRDALAYPSCHMVQNRLLFNIMLFLLQTAPLYLAEYAMRFFQFHKKNKRQNLIKVASRLKAMGELLCYFVSHEWRFSTDNLRRLRERMAPADRALYQFDPHAIKWDEFHRNFMRGCRVHLAGDTDESLPHVNTRMRRILYLIQLAVTALVPLALARLALSSAAFATLLRLTALLTNTLVRSAVSLAHHAGAAVSWLPSLAQYASAAVTWLPNLWTGSAGSSVA